LPRQDAQAGVEDVNRAVVAACKAFDAGLWPKMKTAERTERLRRFAELLVKHAPELERIESLDVGKPVKESDGHDIPRAAHNFSFFADALSQWTQEAYWSESNSLGRDVSPSPAARCCAQHLSQDVPTYGGDSPTVEFFRFDDDPAADGLRESDRRRP
jgi:delta 1-pyrroline-5-carboxylate dehydrogenase